MQFLARLSLYSAITTIIHQISVINGLLGRLRIVRIVEHGQRVSKSFIMKRHYKERLKRGRKQ